MYIFFCKILQIRLYKKGEGGYQGYINMAYVYIIFQTGCMTMEYNNGGLLYFN